MDNEAAHARTVLFYAGHVKDDIENKDAVQTMLDTIMLISSAIGASGADLVFSWFIGEKSIEGGVKSKKEKLKGVLLAIENIRLENPRFQNKRTVIWNHLRKLDKEGTPWTYEKDNVRYEIIFKGKNTLIQKKITEKRENKNYLQKTSFINYF